MSIRGLGNVKLLVLIGFPIADCDLNEYQFEKELRIRNIDSTAEPFSPELPFAHFKSNMGIN